VLVQHTDIKRQIREMENSMSLLLNEAGHQIPRGSFDNQSLPSKFATGVGLQLLTNINEQTLKVRNGYNPIRCGDIVIEVSPGWRLYNEDNQDTQLSRASFIQFPIIFYGAATKAERINDRVTVDRIAPTIAKTIRIRAPNACSAEPLF